MVDRKVVAVAERRTISQLVAIVNRDPRRGQGHEAVMTRITLDDHARAHLAAQGMSVDSVPRQARR